MVLHNMCDGNRGPYSNGELQRFVRALHCPTRWRIIRFIGKGKKSTSEIYEALVEAGEKLSKPTLYYHLSELKNGDIIEVAEYREEGGGAPEKVWKLKTTKLEIDLLK